jgi:hypothetical protein
MGGRTSDFEGDELYRVADFSTAIEKTMMMTMLSRVIAVREVASTPPPKI